MSRFDTSIAVDRDQADWLRKIAEDRHESKAAVLSQIIQNAISQEKIK